MIKKKAGVISLGCDKNRVDTEKMLSALKERYEITPDPEEAEIIVVNTCAFLSSARSEAVDEVLSAAQLKKYGKLEKLVMTGCLPQKFVGDMFDEFTEVDVFLGVSDYDKINEAIDLSYTGVRVNMVGAPKGEPFTRRVLSTEGYAYLKIADGCSNHCTYCLIPSIRGAYRSVPPDKLMEEAAALGELYELILVAQDITKYGSDNKACGNLVSLIRKLSTLENVKHIRLLYCYPENITEELIDEIANNEKVIKYIDMPLQHADDGVLKRMNRKGTFGGYLSLIEKLKARIPGVAVRSTFIAGFPGESEEEFGRLKEFIKKAELANAGFFAYSREEGTAAYKMKGQVPEDIKEERREELYAVQKEVSLKLNEREIGRALEVFTEGFDGALYYGRCYKNAPDIDGRVFFTGKEHKKGDTVAVRITSAEEYDLYGEEI